MKVNSEDQRKHNLAWCKQSVVINTIDT